MNRYRLLHIIDSLQLGGTESRCLEIIGGIDPASFESHLIYFNGGELRAEVEKLKIPHREIKVGRFGSPTFWRGVWSLMQHMRAFSIDLVQTYGFYTNVPGIIAARFAGVAAIVAGRRHSGLCLRPAQQLIDQWLWRFADAVVVNAIPIKDELIKLSVPAAKIVVIHNGVPCVAAPLATTPSPIPIVGMVAKFRPQKDHATFLEAAYLVLAKRPEARFLLVGSGPSEQAARDYSEKLGLGDRVRFLGNRQGSALDEVMESLSIFVLCSHGNEGLPNVVLEAMAAGKPVIATDVGGIRDAVNDRITGFLIPPRDPDVLAEKVLWLIDHPDIAGRMGLLGRQEVEGRFTSNRMIRAFEDLYLSLLHQKALLR